MHFEPIYETDVMLYPGGLTELYNSGKERAELEDLEGIRFIQNYQDEFFRHRCCKRRCIPMEGY